MGISKVVYGGNTLVDLTADTVAAEFLLAGITAHGADGEPIIGTHNDGPLTCEAITFVPDSAGAIPLDSYFHGDLSKILALVAFKTTDPTAIDRCALRMAIHVKMSDSLVRALWAYSSSTNTSTTMSQSSTSYTSLTLVAGNSGARMVRISNVAGSIVSVYAAAAGASNTYGLRVGEEYKVVVVYRD